MILIIFFRSYLCNFKLRYLEVIYALFSGLSLVSVWVLIEPIVREVRSSLLTRREVRPSANLVAGSAATSGSWLNVGTQSSNLINLSVSRLSRSHHLRPGPHVLLNTAQEDQNRNDKQTEDEASHDDHPGADRSTSSCEGVANL